MPQSQGPMNGDLRSRLRDACRVAIEQGDQTPTAGEIEAARALLADRQDGQIYAMSFAETMLADVSRIGAPAGDRTVRMAYVLLYTVSR